MGHYGTLVVAGLSDHTLTLRWIVNLQLPGGSIKQIILTRTVRYRTDEDLALAIHSVPNHVWLYLGISPRSRLGLE